MKIGILGVGWFGLPLARRLQINHTVTGSSRSTEDKSENFKLVELNYPQLPSGEVVNQDVLVINIPPFEQQLAWFKQWNWSNAKQVIFISSTSVYGSHQLSVNELTPPEPDSNSGKLLLEQENWFRQNTNATIVRFGGLLGGERHPGKSLSGKTDLKGPEHPVNLLEREDALNFIEQIILQKPTHQLFNLVHPDHPSRQQFYQNYCRSAGLPLPTFASDPSAGKQVNSLWAHEIFQFRHERVTG